MKSFWDGFEKQSGIVDKLRETFAKGMKVKHEIGKTPDFKVPVEISVGKETQKFINKGGRNIALGLGGFALGALLAKHLRPQDPAPPPKPIPYERREGANIGYV